MIANRLLSPEQARKATRSKSPDPLTLSDHPRPLNPNTTSNSPSSKGKSDVDGELVKSGRSSDQVVNFPDISKARVGRRGVEICTPVKHNSDCFDAGNGCGCE